MPKILLPIRTATWDQHKAIVKVSRQSAYTRPLSEVRYLQDYYSRGWMGVCLDSLDVAGFVLLRHCTRSPWSTVYYLGVDEAHQGRGLGLRLIRWVATASPHAELRTGCGEDNPSMTFFSHLGFEPTGLVRVAKTGLCILELAVSKDRLLA